MSADVTPGVVVNADDLGLNASVNEAIATCFGEGLISSATAMANMSCLAEAAEMAHAGGWVSEVGVHVNLTEGTALTAGMRACARLCDAEGRFLLGPARPGFLSRADRRAVTQEVQAQVRACRDVGLEPMHADSHHHIHTVPQLTGAVARALRAEAITGLRLARNLTAASRAGAKGAYKRLLNWRLRRRGFATTQYFGDLEEFRAERERGSLATGRVEVMVHPDVDAAGQLVDAVDGLPLRQRLANALVGCDLVAYPGR